MKSKPVIPRQAAVDDVEMAIDHYLTESGGDTALNFISALERAYAFISKNPAAGSPRWAHELSLPCLRSWTLKGFPWLVFFVEHENHIDVWRVLNAKRDIPAWLVDPDQ